MFLNMVDLLVAAIELRRREHATPAGTSLLLTRPFAGAGTRAILACGAVCARSGTVAGALPRSHAGTRTHSTARTHPGARTHRSTWTTAARPGQRHAALLGARFHPLPVLVADRLALLPAARAARSR